MYENQDADGEGVSKLEKDHLHEQVYSWRLDGDVWLGLGKDSTGQSIKERLTTSFECGLSSHERGFGKMISIVTELKDYLNEESKRQWHAWEQPTDKDDPDGPATFQTQSLLSLYHHLRWLCDVFQDVPGASVTIR